MAYAGARFTISVRYAALLVRLCVTKPIYIVMKSIPTIFASTYAHSQLLKAMSGESNVVECGFVKSDVTEAGYFATPLLLGKNGLEKNLGYGALTDFEKKKLQEVWCSHECIS